MDKRVFRQVPVIGRDDMLLMDLSMPQQGRSILVTHRLYPDADFGKAWLFMSEDKTMVTADIFINELYMSELIANSYPHIRRGDNLDTIAGIVLRSTPPFNYCNPLRMYDSSVRCDCGARHTSFPNHHSWFCSIERHKKGES